MAWQMNAKRGSPEGQDYSGFSGIPQESVSPMPNELVFKVKLTEEEFQMYLRERVARGLAT